MEFIAIEVLLGYAHTYRYSLESFFYMLLWLCVRRGWKFAGKPKDQPMPSMLAGWYTGNYKEIAQNKLGDIDKGKGKGLGLEAIIEEFPLVFDCVKPLCKTVQDILFLYKDRLFTGTPKDYKVLYVPILKVFDNAVADITSTERSLE
jgi:hypothetical protein